MRFNSLLQDKPLLLGPREASGRKVQPMNETTEATGRQPYVKPFVRNLDVSVTGAGKSSAPSEGSGPSNGVSIGPS
jgi:hypothetical protein